MENNLIKTAQNTLDALHDEHKEVAKKIFQSITRRKVNYEDEPWPATIEELAAIAGVSVEVCKEVIRRFSRHQVLNSDQTLSENSVIRVDESLYNWEQLEAWRQEAYEQSQEYIKWANWARDHQEGRRDILKDLDLKLAITKREEMQPTQVWARRYDPDFERTMAFLDFSHQTERETQLMKQKLANRNRKIFQAIFAFICLLLNGSLISSYIAFEAKKDTEVRAKQIIDAQKQIIDSLQKVIQKAQKNE